MSRRYGPYTLTPAKTAVQVSLDEMELVRRGYDLAVKQVQDAIGQSKERGWNRRARSLEGLVRKLKENAPIAPFNEAQERREG